MKHCKTCVCASKGQTQPDRPRERKIFEKARATAADAAHQLQDLPANLGDKEDVAYLAEVVADEFRQAAEMLEEMATKTRVRR